MVNCDCGASVTVVVIDCSPFIRVAGRGPHDFHGCIDSIFSVTYCDQNLMIISVVNQTNGEISDADLLAAIRAVNRQIAEDFVPYWSMPATLRLEGTRLDQPDANAVAVVRGDAVLYVTSETARS